MLTLRRRIEAALSNTTRHNQSEQGKTGESSCRLRNQGLWDFRNREEKVGSPHSPYSLRSTKELRPGEERERRNDGQYQEYGNWHGSEGVLIGRETRAVRCVNEPLYARRRVCRRCQAPTDAYIKSVLSPSTSTTVYNLSKAHFRVNSQFIEVSNRTRKTRKSPPHITSFHVLAVEALRTSMSCRATRDYYMKANRRKKQRKSKADIRKGERMRIHKDAFVQERHRQ